MKFISTHGSGLLASIALAATPMLAPAGVTVYEDDAKYAEIGGRLQVQYLQVDPDSGESVDDLFFRRLRFYIEGTVTEDIYGIWQMDFGGTSESPEIKDAYIRYSGIPVGAITVGNHNVPFSRELLTSSKRQQFVERQFVGDHNYGVPDRQIGISWSGKTDTVIASVGLYQAGIDDDFDDLDFETRATDDAVYFGNMIAGRIDFNPYGHFKMAQGAFGEDFKLGFGVNAYSWSNDEDIEPFEIDGAIDQYDSVTGAGVDAAVRSGYLSIDAAYQTFSADVLTGAAAGVGIVDAGGDADFDTYLAKAGYMFLPNRFEGVLGYSALDADAWEETDSRISVGGNFFINKHNAKIQVTYEMGKDVEGVSGEDADTFYIQFQQVL